jgi:hypothetical protein
MDRQRIRYEKRGPIRFTSHRDLLRIFRRCFATASVPVGFSQGFNPHPKMSFGPSLRTGWEGLDEYLDVMLDSPMGDLADRCNAVLPDGLRVLDTGRVDETVRKLAADVVAARYEIRVNEKDLFGSSRGDAGGKESEVSRRQMEPHARGEVETFEDFTRAFAERFPAMDRPGDAGPDAAPDTPAMLESVIERQEGHETDTVIRIEIVSTMHGGKSLFPEDILTPFAGDPGSFQTPVHVVRSSLYVKRGNALVSPISRAALESRT